MDAYEEYMRKCAEDYWKLHGQPQEEEEEEEEEEDKEIEVNSETQEYIYEIIKDYLESEILQMSKPDFLDIMVSDVTHIAYQYFVDAGIYDSDSYEIMEAFVSDQSEQFFENKNNIKCPIRHHQHIDHEYYVNKYDMTEEFVEQYLEDKINILRKKNLELPTQRSAEWYEQRNNMMTASNIWQLFSSEAQINRFIYDKCNTAKQMATPENLWINTGTPLHWGVKYEPLTVMIYESMMDAKIEEFGCIPHSQHKFIGASPDGIVTNTDSPYYGRMVEIKNIFNRDMDGVPSEAYWTQMQIQMECCDLNACDFIETRFKEYETANEFYEETEEKTRGLVLNFITRDGTSNLPTYKYLIYDGTPVEPWIDSMKAEMPDKAVFEIKYWFLDDIQITTVERNQMWFDAALPVLQKYWETILYEREHGYEHRVAKKRVSNAVTAITIDTETDTHIIRGMPTSPEGVCLIKLSEEEMGDETI